MNYQPYTYLIGWSKLDKWYYGCQYGKNANPDKLWKSYFTSSPIVKKFREENGEPDLIQIRYIFKTKEQTLKCEEKILHKVNAIKSDKWLNSNIGGKKFSLTTRTEEHKRKIGLANKGLIKSTKGKTHKEIYGEQSERLLKNLSQKFTNVPLSEEHKQKLRKPKSTTINMKKGFLSEEHKQKLRKPKIIKNKEAWLESHKKKKRENSPSLENFFI